MHVGKTDGALGQTVNVWGLDMGVAVAAQGVHAQLIASNEEDVWGLGLCHDSMKQIVELSAKYLRIDQILGCREVILIQRVEFDSVVRHITTDARALDFGDVLLHLTSQFCRGSGGFTHGHCCYCDAAR